MCIGVVWGLHNMCGRFDVESKFVLSYYLHEHTLKPRYRMVCVKHIILYLVYDMSHGWRWPLSAAEYICASLEIMFDVQLAEMLILNVRKYWTRTFDYSIHNTHPILFIQTEIRYNNQTGKCHTLLTHVRLWRSQADGLSHAKSPSISTTIRTYDVLVDLLSQLANKSQTQTPATFRTYI